MAKEEIKVARKKKVPKKRKERLVKAKLEEVNSETESEEAPETQRYLLLTDTGISWGGFTSDYELIGFIDLRANAEAIKQHVINEIQKRGQNNQ